MAREDARECVERYNEAKQIRAPRDTQFRLNAAYCLPRDYENWQGEGNLNDNGINVDFRARFAFDNTGAQPRSSVAPETLRQRSHRRRLR